MQSTGSARATGAPANILLGRIHTIIAETLPQANETARNQIAGRLTYQAVEDLIQHAVTCAFGNLPLYKQDELLSEVMQTFAQRAAQWAVSGFAPTGPPAKAGA